MSKPLSKSLKEKTVQRLWEMDKLNKSIEQLRETVDSLKDHQPSELLEATKVLDRVAQAIEQNDDKKFIKAEIANLAKAIKELKIEVKAPPAEVTNTIVKQDDIYSVYKPSNQDYEDGTTEYYGYLKQNGNWFIMRSSGDKLPNQRYATGLSNYADSWTKRKTLDYKRFDEVRINA